MTTRPIRVGDAWPREDGRGQIHAEPRLIAIEVRYRDGTGATEELFVAPCDVILPADVLRGYLGSKLTLTAHLSYGDRNGEILL